MRDTLGRKVKKPAPNHSWRFGLGRLRMNVTPLTERQKYELGSASNPRKETGNASRP